MQVTDEMVEAGWAKMVGADIAKSCHNASITRGDLKTALSAALAAMWQPIETAPKEDPDRPGCMYEIMIAGGTFYNSMITYPDDIPLVGWALACWDSLAGEWRGENSGGHDEFYFHKPTHWMPKVPAPSQLSKRDDAERDSTHEA